MRPSAPANKMKKRKICISLEVLNEVSTEAPETKHFIDEHLKHKGLKEEISVTEVIYFTLTNLEAKN